MSGGLGIVDSVGGWQKRYRVPQAEAVVIEGHEIRGGGSGRIYNVASAAKSVTAWGVLELADRGLLAIDEPANHYLADWKLRFCDGSLCDATIRQLLDHTGGLGVGIPQHYGDPGKVPPIETSLANEDVVAEHRPGERFLYANGGYAVVQAVVERVTGASFADVMQQVVLEPLAMSESSFDPRTLARSAERPHRRTDWPLETEYSAWTAAGGLWCTSDDLGRYVAALIGAGHGETNGPVSPDRLAQVATTSPAGAGAFGLRRGGYGLGHAWTRGPNGNLFVANQGSNPGWKAVFAALPGNAHGLVVVTNSDTGMLLLVEAALTWLARTGALTTPHRAVSAARKALVAIAVAALADAGRRLGTRQASPRPARLAAIIASLAVGRSPRLLDRAGLGPVELDRAIHPMLPLVLAAAGAAETVGVLRTR